MELNECLQKKTLCLTDVPCNLENDRNTCTVKLVGALWVNE